MTLDVFDLCSSDLKNKLQPMRDQFKEEEEKNVLRVKIFFDIIYFYIINCTTYNS